ncbi:MAG: glycosyltransferase [Phycisphaerales bacterium]|jgi:glycosyltransferase involved in cell wall biosynthesis|nr:glycosyltransferase [Phycisphaerales bacterium]
MNPPRRILINGLSIGSGGGYTVGRELFRHMAELRPDWTFTLALIEGHTLHDNFRRESLPTNAHLLWAPATTLRRVARNKYENDALVRWAIDNHVNAVVQLNGMVIRRMPIPTLAHFQDPWPYRTEAWTSRKDPVIAFLKRRAHARALRLAACCGFTSAYLRDLIVGRLRIQPKRAEVFYNGLPPSWIERAGGLLPDWNARPMEMASVSNVGPYKRQSLVIEALPQLVNRPGLEKLIYRIAGHCPADYRAHLQSLARRLSVEKHVVIEGRVSDARVEEILRQSRCFVLMSVCESFGIPAIEAMSFGTPTVVSDCCAMPEVCGQAADLSPVDDLPALTENLARALTDPTHAEQLRRAGAAQAQKFQWRQTAQQMAECLGGF